MSLSKEANALREVLKDIGVQCEANVNAIMDAAADYIAGKALYKAAPAKMTYPEEVDALVEKDEALEDPTSPVDEGQVIVLKSKPKAKKPGAKKLK